MGNGKACGKRNEAQRPCLFEDGHEPPCAFSFGAALALRYDAIVPCTQCREPCCGKKGDVVSLCMRCIINNWPSMRD